MRNPIRGQKLAWKSTTLHNQCLSQWAYPFSISETAQIATAAAAFIAAIVAIAQSIMTRQQISSSLRPWTSLSLPSVVPGTQQSHRLQITLRNYGQLPCISATAEVYLKDAPISPSELENRKLRLMESIELGVINSTQEKSLTFFIPTDLENIFHVTNRPHSLYLGVRVIFRYANNRKDQYYTIYAPDPSMPMQFVSRYEWIPKQRGWSARNMTARSAPE